jgi:UDP-glucose 4-epimerase
VLGTRSLLIACNNSLVKNFIFSSTAAVYKEGQKIVSEKSKVNPKSVYGKTKLIAEKQIILNCKKMKINYGILRYFNVAGASNSGKIGEIEKSYGHLIKNLAGQSLKSQPKVSIYGKNYNTKDGTCIRDYIHVSDLADIHLKTLKKITKTKKSIILNCGYGKGYSVKEIVDIFKLLKKDVIVQYQKRRVGDIAQIYADTKKIKKDLNWKPKFNDIKKILISAIKWEKKLKKLR